MAKLLDNESTELLLRIWKNRNNRKGYGEYTDTYLFNVKYTLAQRGELDLDNTDMENLSQTQIDAYCNSWNRISKTGC